ncbi:hypothetical protein [Amycolatopsis nalaikhensis]|uniref:J domain-containing protein n=1 Tax=Amycolatopsis nalaikhensis TaxID=715472 RepID=A0ABY8XM66_9PSEU|nr:hypothetical protein [Amycolatopsis sp. 2-2]WIV56635.1 hypothetical protein QP939_49000 [Amycolatopsis sp. 2-2]
MTGRGEGDAAGRAAFRAFVRAHHPDVGGDPAEFAAGLARFRESEVDDARPNVAFGASDAPKAAFGASDATKAALGRFDAPVTFVVNRRGIAAVLARFRRRRRPPRVR